jgi:tetratricopeptide (TPR) repeat protein
MSENTSPPANRAAQWLVALAVIAILAAIGFTFMATQNRQAASVAEAAASTRIANAAEAEATAQGQVDMAATAMAQAEADSAAAQDDVDAAATAVNLAEADLADAAASATAVADDVGAAATNAAELDAVVATSAALGTVIAGNVGDLRGQAQNIGTEVARAVGTATRVPPTLTQAAALADEQQATAQAAATEAADAAATLAGLPPTLTKVAILEEGAATEREIATALVGVAAQVGTDAEGALEQLNTLDEQFPEQPLVLLTRARVQVILEQYEAALADYAVVIEADDENALLYQERGDIYRTLEQYPEALADYNAAVGLAPDDAALYYGRGLVFQTSNRFNRALGDFDRALELDPEFTLAYLTRGRLNLDLLDFDAALADFDAAAELDPTNPVIYQERGDLYYELADFEAAAADYNAYAELTGTLEIYMADRLAGTANQVPFTLDAPSTDNLVFRTQGSIPHDEDNDFIETFDPGGFFLADFVVDVTYENPYAPTLRDWDYGFFFRSVEASYQLVTYSEGFWELFYAAEEFEFIQGGELPNFDTRADGSNRLRLEVQGDRGVFYVNEVFVANLDLSALSGPGSILLATGFVENSEINGETTRFSDLAVQAIGEVDDSPPPPTEAPPPAEGAVAQGGENVGEIASGGTQVWTYAGVEDEALTIRTEADWDTVLRLYLDGEEIAYNDDITLLINTNSEITITLPVTATYEIVVAGFGDEDWGPYTLTVESGETKAPVTPTPGS